MQRELDLGRATLTAPLPGLAVPLADGAPGEVEQAVLDSLAIDMADFRVRELPEVASAGRRRGILQPVRDLAVAWEPAARHDPEDRADARGDAAMDPVFGFTLGKGSYATVVLSEFMKGQAADY